MRRFGGSPGQTRVCKGSPRAAPGVRAVARAPSPGVLHPSRAPGQAPIGGGAACGWPGTRAGSLSRVSPEPPRSILRPELQPPPQRPASCLPPSRPPLPASLLAGLVGLLRSPLTTSVSQIPAENWGGMQKQLVLAPQHLRYYFICNNLRSKGKAWAAYICQRNGMQPVVQPQRRLRSVDLRPAGRPVVRWLLLMCNI